MDVGFGGVGVGRCRIWELPDFRDSGFWGCRVWWTSVGFGFGVYNLIGPHLRMNHLEFHRDRALSTDPKGRLVTGGPGEGERPFVV